MKKINGVILITAGVLMLAGCASPTPTPTVSPTETSSASPSPTETVSPSPTSSPTPTDSVFIGIDSPTEGAMVSSPVTLSGTSCIFEAQFQFKLQSGAAIIKTGTIMADAGCPNIGNWSLTLKALAAGDYKFTAFARSLKDGSVIAKTVRNFTVQ